LVNSADRSIVGTHYDRYQGVEHEAVWADLISLGSAVYEEPVHSDALAVARETMSRARQISKR